LGWHYLVARQYDLAIAQLKNTLEMDPNFSLAHSLLGQAYQHKGLYEEAKLEFQKAARVRWTALAYALTGQKAEAEKALRALKEQSKQRYIASTDIALTYAALGEREQGFIWLEKAYEERGSDLIYLKVDPWFDPLRDEPRFQALLRRMNFPE
jgi:Tfp pilus assembly protein PilF